MMLPAGEQQKGQEEQWYILFHLAAVWRFPGVFFSMSIHSNKCNEQKAFAVNRYYFLLPRLFYYLSMHCGFEAPDGPGQVKNFVKYEN